MGSCEKGPRGNGKGRWSVCIGAGQARRGGKGQNDLKGIQLPPGKEKGTGRVPRGIAIVQGKKKKGHGILGEGSRDERRGC